jgi:class 3 adenylate cyclase
MPGLLDRLVAFLRRLLVAAYARLGPRYPTVALAIVLQSGFLIAVGAVLVYTRYVDLTDRQLIPFLTTVAGMSAFAIVYATVRGHRLLRPVRAWMEGPRDGESSLSAWRAAVGLPLDLWPRLWWREPAVLMAVIDVLAADILNLTLEESFALLLGSFVALGYAAVLQALAIESALRPVVEEIAPGLPPDFEFGTTAFPLRFKLLAVLPLINVISGVIVASLSSPERQAAALGLDVLIATGVALSVSLVLTAPFARSLVAPLRNLVDAAEAVEQGDFAVRVPVTTSDEVGLVARAFNKMVAGLAERDQIRDALGTYVDHDVAEHILDESDLLEGEEVDVTVMFLDVRDFTGFVERATAAEVVGTLNRLFERVVPLIAEHGGHVDKFIGDGLLAVFGVPLRHADHADRALAAALVIDRVVRRDFGDDLAVGIGLNSGPVVAGNIGGGGRLEFSVIGDAVNVAARVEAATRQTGDSVLISEDTLQRAADPTVEFVRRKRVRLKGKSDPVDLFAPRPVGEARPAATSHTAPRRRE